MTDQPASDRPFRSLASRLVRGVVLVCLGCALLVMVLRGWLVWHVESESLARTTQDIAQSRLPLLSGALWDIQTQTAQAQVDEIARHPQVAGVRLVTVGGLSFKAGAPLPAGKADVELAVPRPQGKGAPLGHLTIAFNHDFARAELARSFLRTLVAGSVITLIAYLALVRFLRREVSEPLRRIADYAGRLQPGALAPPLDYVRAERPWRDDIDLVAEGFRTLHDGLQRYVSERDAALHALAQERDQLEATVLERTADLARLNQELLRLSRSDALTGLPNRRAFDEHKLEELRRARRQRHPLTVIVADIDFFKLYNDRYGHSAGDDCLVRVAQCLAGLFKRPGECVARLGGEEFAVLLPETELNEAGQQGERIRTAVADLGLVHEGAAPGVVSVSVGVATLADHSQEGHSEEALASAFDLLFGRADAALYMAKGAGRNIVRVHPAPP